MFRKNVCWFILWIISLLFFHVAASHAAELMPTIHSYDGIREWHNPDTWQEGRTPDENDVVEINGTVLLDGNAVVKGLVVSFTSLLQGYNSTLTVNGDVINYGEIADRGSYDLNLRISGEIVQNGTWSNNQTFIFWPENEAADKYDFNITEIPYDWPDPKTVSATFYDVTMLPPEEHYWRVRPIIDGSPGSWSEPKKIQIGFSQNGIDDQNMETANDIALKDMACPENTAFCYGINENILYVSINTDEFVVLKETDFRLNAIADSDSYTLAVGENGKMVGIGFSSHTMEIQIPGIDVNLLDVAGVTDKKFIITGQQGTIVRYNANDGVHTVETSGTSADLNGVFYDKDTTHVYAVSSAGEFLDSPDGGKTWNIQNIIDAKLNAVTRKDNKIVVTGDNGVVYFSTDAVNFIEAESGTLANLTDVIFVNERFVIASLTGLFTSETCENWIKDSANFTENNIHGLYADGRTLLALSEKGILSIDKFKNVIGGTTQTPTLGGVDVRFEQSDVTFEYGDILPFDNIVAEDTMYILKEGEIIGKIVFGQNVKFAYYTENVSTLESILKKSQEYVEISGDNTLYYHVSDDQYAPVSSGQFWLKDGKVMEKPLFSQISDNTESELKSNISNFSRYAYRGLYNSATDDQKKNLMPQPDMENTLYAMVSIAKLASFDMPITNNELLLGNLSKPFSPLFITSPFFRRLYLDADDGKIYQKESYFFGPNFIVQALLTAFNVKDLKFSLPKLEYVVEGDSLTGTISDFEMNIGPFKVFAEKASVESTLVPSSDDEDVIVIEEAGLTLKTTIENFRKINKNQSASIGGKINELKLVHNEEGFKLVSGEAGAELKIPNLNITPRWALEDLTTYLMLVFRELDVDGPYKYNDEYPDELDEFLVYLGGEGKLRRRSIPSKNMPGDFMMEAGIDLAFDANSFDFDGEDRQNLIRVDVKTKDWFSFPKAGKFSLTGVGGGYQYSKSGPSYWSLYADFKLFKATKNAFLFEGGAHIAADMGLDSLGLGVTYFRTPIGTKLYLDWTDDNDTACVLMGKIRHDMPVDCPDVEDCTGRAFALKPENSSQEFTGLGLGIKSSISLMDKKTKKPYEIGIAKVEDILVGARGAKIYGISEEDQAKEMSISLVGYEELRLPKITTDWFFIPESLKQGKTLGAVCVSLGYFNITKEDKNWIWADKEYDLGKHFGLYAKATLVNKELPIFIPLDRLEDEKGEQIFFVTNMKIESTNLKKRMIMARAGETVNDSFAVGENTSLIIIDLVSSDNTITVTTPSGDVITETSENQDNKMEIDKIDGKYTDIAIADPEPGTWLVSYVNTEDQTIKIFGSNNPPSATLSLNDNIATFSLEDAENDPIEYSLALVDYSGETALTLQEAQTVEASDELTFEIPDIDYLDSGNYKVMLQYSDNLSPVEKLVSSGSIYLEKVIPAPENLTAISTSDFVDISWDPNPGADGYKAVVQMQGEVVQEHDLLSSMVRVSELPEGDYTVLVSGYDENDLTGAQASVEFTVARGVSADIPSPVADVSLEFTDAQAKIYWTPPEGADFYEVSLKHANTMIYQNRNIQEPFITISDEYFGATLDVTIVARNTQNNGSQALSRSVQIFDDADTDEDGLPDMWEERYFSGLSYGETDDFDSDGLANGAEFSKGTNPARNDTDYDKVSDDKDAHPLENKDEDDNTIPDDWEARYAISDIMGDPDEDGYANYIEYLADMDPSTPDPEGIDISKFEAIDFSPVVKANIEDMSIVKQNEPVTVDLSSSFDINGDELTFSWTLNSERLDNEGSALTLDTGKVGMYRIEVDIADGNGSVYRKYSVFVTDGATARLESGDMRIHEEFVPVDRRRGMGSRSLYGIVDLENYDMKVPAGAMGENTYLVAGDISLESIPVRIMGREIVTDGFIFFYSDGYKLETPVSITPYVQDDDEIDPYIFNYGTSVWTNLNTGETFEPIMPRMIPNTDGSYALSTKETGILTFARRPMETALSPVTTLSAENKVYFIDMEKFKADHNLSYIDDVSVSDGNVLNVSHGYVSGAEEVRLDVEGAGTSQIVVSGTNTLGEQVRYTYLTKINEISPELSKAVLCLKILAGIETGFGIELPDDIDQDTKIGMAEVIHALRLAAGLE